jgi:sugar phosphate isomerase/epimerase
MIFGIPASACGVDMSKEGSIESLLSYCNEVGVNCVSINPPVLNGKPDVEALSKLKEQINNVGLKVFGGGIFYAREGNFFDESVRNEQGQQVIELIRCYGKAKVEPVTIFCFVEPSQDADEQKKRWKLATDFLRSLVDEAESVNARIAIHTLTNSVFNNYESVMQMFSDVPSDYLGVCYDVAIHTELKDDISMNIKALKNKMPLMHLRTIGDVTPWKDFEIKDGKLQKAEKLVIQVDFPAMMRALLESGYDGILALEHQPSAISYARAVGYLKGVLEVVKGIVK